MNTFTINLVNNVNFIIFVIFTLLYSYQFYYLYIVLKRKNIKLNPANRLNRFAIVISARNESIVIEEIIKTIKSQNYPQHLLDVFVVADNCTDNTAKISRKAGAYVYERFDKNKIGKGYALDFLFKEIKNKHHDRYYDGYFIFDADNLLSQDYVAEMNKVFNSGYDIVTSYRNSKNYDSNWISAGYALWFLRESKYLNHARMMLGTSCAVSGTGFLVSSKIISKNNGWIYHLLTEDIEFSIDNVITGEKIGYCPTAIFYDEQPTSMKDSWNQRLRWSKGFYQVFYKYGINLFKSIIKKRDFSCFDMLMTIAPAILISLATIIFNLYFLISASINPFMDNQLIKVTSMAIFTSLFNYYIVLYAFGVITTITEWNNIHAVKFKKILYTFTFPIFIFTYIPISIVALFKKVDWKPISHSIVKTIDEVKINTIKNIS